MPRDAATNRKVSDSPNSSGNTFWHHVEMQPDLRTSIKDYRRDKPENPADQDAVQPPAILSALVEDPRLRFIPGLRWLSRMGRLPIPEKSSPCPLPKRGEGGPFASGPGERLSFVSGRNVSGHLRPRVHFHRHQPQARGCRTVRGFRSPDPPRRRACQGCRLCRRYQRSVPKVFRSRLDDDRCL